ncbi:MAG: UbiD family decarboxylase [Syntrophales bacterium LBB04]|nr:UbiD family decarboxylase [Syntrophales bacterium LBB04]
MALSKEGISVDRFNIVGDDDIDPSNLEEVVWAMCTRCNPEISLDIIKRCLSSPLDPVFNKNGPVPWNQLNARVIVEACRPFEWMKDFPPMVGITPQEKDEIERKWGMLFKWSALAEPGLKVCRL